MLRSLRSQSIRSNIFLATYGNDLALITEFLNTGTPINVRSDHNTFSSEHYDAVYQGSTPLHLASESHVDIEIMRYLLEKGADIQARNQQGQTPLHIAVENGTTQHVDALLKAGAKPNVQDKNGKTAMHIAAEKNNTPTLFTLLANRANIEARNFEEQTPLHVAVCANNIPAINILLERGADIEARDFKGQTPLHLAANLSTAVKKLLVERGANLNAKDNRGRAPVFYEIEDYHIDKKDLQFVTEESVKTTDKERNTPLHVAVISGCTITLKRILECHPNIHAQNIHGESPLNIAYHYGRNEIAVRLEYEACLQEDAARILASPPRTFAPQQAYDKNSATASSSSSATPSSSRNRRNNKRRKRKPLKTS